MLGGKLKGGVEKSLWVVFLIISVIGLVQAATLAFSPSSQQVALGDDFQVNITVTDVLDLYSYQFDLNFNPAVAQYVSIDYGPFLESDGATVFQIDPDNSTSGLLRNYAATRLGTLSGIDGSGVIAIINFRTLAEGTSDFSLSNDFLFDNNSTNPQEILHDSQTGSAIIVDCDVDGDGYSSITCGGADCNDDDSNEFPGQTWYKDEDGDLYSDGTTLVQCSRPVGYKVFSELTQASGDCNDLNANINPEATEVCDGIDNNCDYSIDEGFTAENCQFVCEELGANFNASRDLPYTCCGNNAGEDSPFEEPETSCYDGSDNDCDGRVDILDSDCSGVCTNSGEDDYWVYPETDCNQCGYDGDNDGDQPGDWSAYPGMADQCDADCGTVSATVDLSYFESTETSCDGIDNDCDGTIDEGVKTTYYRDNDGDGYGNPSVSIQSCTPVAGYVLDNTDCDDNDPDEFPNQIWYKDLDGDLYSDGTTLTQCTRPTNYYLENELTQTSGDCADFDPNINPSVPEICDGIDNNCIGGIDDGFTAENCQSVCEDLGFNFDFSRSVFGSSLVCCGNDAGEDSPYQVTETSCSDFSDNDCDGDVDLDDIDCVLSLYDLNLDGRVDIADVSMAAMQFGAICASPDWCGRRDVNRDAEINIRDLSLIGMHFT